jgi:hypothetical protein
MAKRRLNDTEKEIVEAVQTHGFFSMGVLPEKDSPSFLYSIGFWETLDSPEVILLGLNGKVMHSMVWRLFRRMKDGLALRDGMRIPDLLSGDFECVARAAHTSQIQEYMLSARWYCRHSGRDELALRAYQIFWPSERTRLYPWDANCELDVRQLQPLLYLPREVGLA